MPERFVTAVMDVCVKGIGSYDPPMTRYEYQVVIVQDHLLAGNAGGDGSAMLTNT
jgi:hypothetical protein